MIIFVYQIKVEGIGKTIEYNLQDIYIKNVKYINIVLKSIK